MKNINTLGMRLYSTNWKLLYALRLIFSLFIIFLISSCSNTKISSAEAINAEANSSNYNMYVIERNVPGAGKLTSEELQSISQTSCGVLDDMGSDIKWMHSYVTGDKIFCVYTAPNEEMVREHAKQGGFPADAVLLVNTVIDPSTAE